LTVILTLIVNRDASNVVGRVARCRNHPRWVFGSQVARIWSASGSEHSCCWGTLEAVQYMAPVLDILPAQGSVGNAVAYNCSVVGCNCAATALALAKVVCHTPPVEVAASRDMVAPGGFEAAGSSDNSRLRPSRELLDVCTSCYSVLEGFRLSDGRGGVKRRSI
jgi:hypothetical protein